MSKLSANERWLIVALFVIIVILVFFLLQMSPAQQSSGGEILQQVRVETITATLLIPENLFPGNTTTEQVDLVVQIPTRRSDPPTQAESRLLQIVLTGLFTLFGSGIVLVYNYIAGNSSRKFEWGKHLWNKYESHYLDLRNTVKNTDDAKVIKNKMDVLVKEIILPPKLEEELLDLVAFLQTEISAEKRRKRRERFLEFFEDFVARPWKYL